MSSKISITIFAGIIIMCSLSGCKKKTEYVQATVLSYYIGKINGINNWAGTYYNYTSHTIDTNVRLEIKAISDSIIIVHIANREQILYYGETNEMAKTILFTGRYDNLNSNYFSLRIIYSYADDHMKYEEYYYNHPSGFKMTNLSAMILNRL